MKNQIVLFLFLTIFGGKVMGQSERIRTEPDLNKASCGVDLAYMETLASKELRDKLNHIVEEAKEERVNSTSPKIICGRFRFTFDDIVLGTGSGFDNPALGSAYRQCVCNVATYLQSIYDIPTGDASYIDIVFENSWTFVNPNPNANVLAVGGSLLTNQNFINGLPGFYGGNTYDHFTTGIDPDPNAVDGTITVNFTQNYFTCGNSPTCTSYDFESVILHELTHVLGWVSFLTEDAGLLPTNYLGVNQFSIYDKNFLYHGDILNGNLQHIVDTISGTISSGLPASCLRDNKLWYYSLPAYTQLDNLNFSVFAVEPQPSSPSGAPNSISHISNGQNVFIQNSCLSPGFQPDYIMSAFFVMGQEINGYSPQEIRALNRMGYQYSNTFQSTNSAFIHNHHPFTTKRIIKPEWIVVPPYPASDQADYPPSTPAGFTINNCDSVRISLAADTQIVDIDSGDVKRIYPGSLFNIRGCGNGGNNHNCLSVQSTPTGDIITFKPRHNFIGRAQFGFNLYDGKERGAFMVYTIDVTGCAPNGPNLVVNGNFEEGMEVVNSTNYLENSILRHGRDLYYMDGFGTMYPDGVKYVGYNIIIVKDSYDCNPVNGQYGFPNYSFSSPGSTAIAAASNGGNRYYLINNYFSSLRLYSPMQTCGKYDFEFDYCMMSSTTGSIQIGFTTNPGAFNSPPQPYVNKTTVTLTGTIGVWYHKKVPIIYCDTLSADFLLIKTLMPGSILTFGIDNADLRKDAVNCQLCLTSIQEEDVEANSLGVVFPNPANDELFIELKDKGLIYSVEVYNSLGEIVYTEKSVQSDLTLKTDKYSDGIYFVRLTNKTESQFVKVLIQH